MPTIEVRPASTSVSTGLGGVSANPDAFGAGVGRAIEQAGFALQQTGNALAQKVIRDDMTQASQLAVQSISQWDAYRIEKETNAEPGAPEFTSNLLKEYDDFVDSQGKSARTPAGRQYLQEKLTDYRLQLQRQSMAFEAKAGIDHRRNLLQQSVQQAGNQLVTSPQLLDMQLEAFSDGVSMSGLPPAEREAMLIDGANALGEAAIQGIILKDPQAALDLLEEGDFDKYLTPAKKIQLMASAKTQQRADVGLFKDNARDVIELMNKGGFVEKAELLQKASQAVELGEPELAKDLSEAASLSEFQRTFLTLPPESERDAEGNIILEGQADMITRLRGDPNTKTSLIEIKKLEMAESLHAETKKGLDNPLQLVNSNIGIPLQPIQIGEDGRLDPQWLANRKQTAKTAAYHVKRKPTYFTDSEVEELMNRYENQGPIGKVRMMSDLSAGFTDRELADVAVQLSPKDSSFASALMLSKRNPRLAQNVIKGKEVVKEKLAPVPPNSQFDEIWSGLIGSAITNAQVFGQLRDATKYAYIAQEFDAGRSVAQLDNGVYEDVIEEAVGAPVSLNSASFLPFRRKDGKWAQRADFTSVLREVGKRPEILDKTMGGRPFDGELNPIDPKTFLEEAQLESVGDGQYLVRINGGALQYKNGRRYILDMPKIWQEASVVSQDDPQTPVAKRRARRGQ